MEKPGPCFQTKSCKTWKQDFIVIRGVDVKQVNNELITKHSIIIESRFHSNL